jgi:hypothetical protein
MTLKNMTVQILTSNMALVEWLRFFSVWRRLKLMVLYPKQYSAFFWHTANCFCLGPKLSADCQSKVMDAKERIMGDYELSHALVEQCHNDVNRFCQKEADSNEEGAVIDCLMGKVADDSEDDHGQQRQPTETISVGCTEEVLVCGECFNSFSETLAEAHHV